MNQKVALWASCLIPLVLLLADWLRWMKGVDACLDQGGVFDPRHRDVCRFDVSTAFQPAYLEQQWGTAAGLVIISLMMTAIAFRRRNWQQ